MYERSSIKISIDSTVYEQMINNVLNKAPLEIGVEVLVYMLLYGLTENTEYIVADINSMKRKYAKQYAALEIDSKESKFGAVPDLVVLNNSFVYASASEKKQCALGFVEIKNLKEKLNIQDGEIQSHMKNARHFIWTNGKTWHYFLGGKEEWSIELCDKSRSKTILIDEVKFDELLYRLSNINWGK